MTFENLLALGFIPAIFITGHWVLGKLFDDTQNAFEGMPRLAAGAVVGIALWLPLIVATAWFGVYGPHWIGLASWIVSAFGAAKLRRSPALSFDAAGVFALLIASAAFVWNSHYATESFRGGRDQGVYSNHAVLIAETGDLRSEPIFEELFTQERFTLATGNQAGGYFFDRDSGNIYFQFMPTFASLLAQGYGIGGYNGLLSVNPFLCLLNGLIFYGLLRKSIPRVWALAGMVFFTFNLVQFWNTRITLSEILAQSFILGGLLIASQAFSAKARGAFALGCGIVALNAAVRVDGFLALAGVGFFVLLVRVTRRGDAQADGLNLLRWGIAGALLASLACLLFDQYSSPGYFSSLSERIYLLTAFAIGLAVVSIAPLPSALLERTAKTLASPAAFWAIAAVVLGLLGYAYFVRPYIEPFSVLQDTHPNAGHRDYRERSLLDVTAYLSPGVILFSIAGMLLALRRALRGGETPLLLTLCVWSLFTALYLYNPSISPDHIWKMRRFSPIVLPGFIAIAAVAWAWTLNKIRFGELRMLAALAALSLLAAHLGRTGKVLAFTKLNEGFFEFANTIADAIPDGAVVATNIDRPLLGPLQLAKDYEIIRPNPRFPTHPAFVADYAETLKAQGKDVYLLAPTESFSSSRLEKGRSFIHSAWELVPTDLPFPIEIREVVYRAYLAPMGDLFLGYAAEDPRIVIGATPIIGVEESGMKGQEHNGEQAFRWTGAKATFSLPWIFDREPIGATIAIGGAKPGGSRIRLSANGQEIIDREIPDSGATLELPLEKFDWSVERLELALQSEPWIPKDAVEGSEDERTLGVQLYGIDFRFERDDLIDEAEFGHSPSYGIAESGLYDTERIDDEPYRWTDGNARFAFELKPNFAPLRLSIELRSAPPQSQRLRVTWNGSAIFETDALAPPQTIKIELSEEFSSSRAVELNIESDTFVPAEAEEGSADERTLGVMIGRIRLEGESASR